MTLLDVCNRALSRIGAARIAGLNEGSASGRAMSACFPSVPDSVLATWAWAFAIRREVLYYAEPRCVETEAVWAYELPGDCLAIAPEFVGGAPEGRKTGWWPAGGTATGGRMEGGLFVTDQGPPLNLRYVAQVTDASEWDPAFSEVLAWRLAIEVQPELSPVFAESRLQTGLTKALRAARRSGAIETAGGTLEDSVWLVSRL